MQENYYSNERTFAQDPAQDSAFGAYYYAPNTNAGDYYQQQMNMYNPFQPSQPQSGYNMGYPYNNQPQSGYNMNQLYNPYQPQNGYNMGYPYNNQPQSCYNMGYPYQGQSQYPYGQNFMNPPQSGYNMGYPYNNQPQDSGYNMGYPYNNQPQSGYNMGYPYQGQSFNPQQSGYNMGYGYNPNPVFQQQAEDSISIAGANYNNGYYGNYGQHAPDKIQITLKTPSLGGEYMPPANYQNKIANMQLDYMCKEIEEDVRLDHERKNMKYGESNVYGVNNFYGNPYFGYYGADAIRGNVIQEIETFKNEARERRKEFDIGLYTMVHNYLNDGITEDQVREAYEGKTITVDTPYYIKANYFPDPEAEWGKYSVPYEDQEYKMWRASDAALQARLDEFVPPDSNMREFFAKIGDYMLANALEEEYRKRDLQSSQRINTNSYLNYIKKTEQNRYMRSQNNYAGDSYVQENANFIPEFRDGVDPFQTTLDDYPDIVANFEKVLATADDETIDNMIGKLEHLKEQDLRINDDGTINMFIPSDVPEEEYRRHIDEALDVFKFTKSMPRTKKKFRYTGKGGEG